MQDTAEKLVSYILNALTHLSHQRTFIAFIVVWARLCISLEICDCTHFAYYHMYQLISFTWKLLDHLCCRWF